MLKKEKGNGSRLMIKARSMRAFSFMVLVNRCFASDVASAPGRFGG